ncbi:MAG: amidohydrolase family protein, partial [Clostridiaceae bacterium]|nr:amidohydrolase family protein [Clostridiaceae bacterium]
DHAPHHFDEKNVEFANSPNGIVGFETALSLSYTKLVETKILSLPQLVDKLAAKPAQILKLKKGHLDINEDADLILVDFNKEYSIDVSKFASKSKNSPFNGYKVKGRNMMTIVSGKIVYEADEGIF